MNKQRRQTYVVMRTESATFPFDIKVATFDAWPPGQHETKITPVARGADNFKVYKQKNINQTSQNTMYISTRTRILLCQMLIQQTMMQQFEVYKFQPDFQV